MASSFAEALKGIEINFEGVEDKEMTEEQYQAEQDIKMLEQYMKLAKRNASEKELFQFAKRWNFLSMTHFRLWLSVTDELNNAESDLEFAEDTGMVDEALYLEKKMKELKLQAKNMRQASYYQMMMRLMKKKDYSPYGEDLLKKDLKSKDKDARTIDIEKTIASGFQHVMSYKR